MNKNQSDVLVAVWKRPQTTAQIAARCGKSVRSVASTLCCLRGAGFVDDGQIARRYRNGSASYQPAGPVKWRLA